MERKEVSPIKQEFSPLTEESAPMSATADVSEMQGICADIVTRLAGLDMQKQQVPKLAKMIGVTENRALEFLRAKARRIDSWEKDRARTIRDQLKRSEGRQRELEHLAWLREQVEGIGGRGGDVLQHLLRGAGDEAGSLAVLPEDEDQSVNWR
jgi:hypothetical protein